eukprot:4730157-Pyramimonas_sp.AAC.2
MGSVPSSCIYHVASRIRVARPQCAHYRHGGWARAGLACPGACAGRHPCPAARRRLLGCARAESEVCLSELGPTHLVDAPFAI